MPRTGRKLFDEPPFTPFTPCFSLEASVSDLTGYATLGKLEFGNNVGQYGKNQNITPVEQHCRLYKHILLTLSV